MRLPRSQKLSYLVHVFWSDDVWFFFKEHDDLVILLPGCGKVVEVDPDVSVRSRLQVHGEHQNIAIIKEVVHLLILH